MAGAPLDEEAIFKAACKIVSPEDRADYLTRACADDPALRDRVAVLLRVHDEERDFLESPPPGLDGTFDPPPVAERPGQMIGRYKLLEELGEGGMGVVYLAEQQQPVRREVALKIIKPGMDTRAVVARFEAERQALALMDHPNIAKVLDAGATDSGRPYFVMELVRGVPLTDYCDQNALTVRERLQLFVQVCQAVQHAHGKGIIHRDLKPSNVTVALYDGVPVPKIIDFGIAKATNRRLTEETPFTGFGQMIGTPLYMSPEQVEMSGLDVDTRTDTYSLGVMLYELLTGSTPLDRQRLREAGHEEIRRMIREEEPPRPSCRITALGQSATTVAAHRRTEPAKLRQLMRRDLDWIVMKALQRDRTRRYQTATDLGREIQRYLAGEPIEARPPTLVDWAVKWSRRRRLAVGLVVATLILGVAVLLPLVLAISRLRVREQVPPALPERQEEVVGEEERMAAAPWRSVGPPPPSLGRPLHILPGLGVALPKGAHFGRSAAIHGPRTVVGAPDAASGDGRAYLFDSASGALVATLSNPKSPAMAAGGRFGYCVAVSGKYVVVGAYAEDAESIGSGAAYLFDAGDGRYLRALPNPTPGSRDCFGVSVSVSEDHVVIGATKDGARGTNAGAAYVFAASSGRLLSTLQKPEPAANDHFGGTTAIAGDTVVVCAGGATDSGAGYVFSASNLAGVCRQVLRNPRPRTGDQFADSAAVWGNTVLLTATGAHRGAAKAGAAYVFDLGANHPPRELHNPAPKPNGYFGYSVGTSGNTAVVGAPFDDHGAPDAGAAYVYDLATGKILGRLHKPAPAAGDHFGIVVAMSGNTVVVGAYEDDTQAVDAGAAYVFDISRSPAGGRETRRTVR